MISMNDYTSLDATAMAAAVAAGEMSAAELIDAAMRAVEAVNPSVNAVLQTLAERARAGLSDVPAGAPFSGVPFVIKELSLSAAGVSQDMGSRLTQGFTPSADSELMARFRRAGLVLVGTTQTPEFGYSPTTETILHGAVHNPWDATRSAGGSSGGSAAAVAAGMVPLAHANDGGGSIRIPAGCNGLVGLKPSRDRIPTGPGSADPLSGLAIEFAVTRSVRDCAALLDAVAGPDLGAPSFCIPPQRPFLAEVGAASGRLRVAFSALPPSGGHVDPECVRAVRRAADQLSALGHIVEEAAPVFDWERFLTTVHVLWCAGTAAPVLGVSAALGRTPSPDNMEAVTWACLEAGRGFSAVELLGAMAHHNSVARSVAPFFQQYDVFVTPTIAELPATLGTLNQNRAGMSAMDWTRQVFAYCPFTPLFNTTGQPAMSLPLHWTDAGLPVGVQIVGRFGDESTLIRLAAQLEQAMPWAARRAGIHAAA